MEDFFSKFRKKLFNREQPTFEEKDWQKLELILDQQENSKKRFGFLWWPIFIAFPVLTAWTWLNWINRQDANIISKVSSATDTIRIHDTVYIKEFIDNPRIVYVKEDYNSVNQVYSAKKVAVNQMQISEIESENSVESIEKLNEFPHQSIADLGQPTSTKEISWEQIGQNLENLNPVPVDSNFELPKVTPGVSLPALAGNGSLIRRIKKSIVPIQILAGFNIAYPMIAESYALNKLAYLFSIEAAVLFPSSLKLSISPQFENLYYGSRSFEEGSGIAMVDPPSPDFIFNKVEISKTSYNISSILSYRFFRMHRFKPVVGLGLSFNHTTPYQVVYEFEQQQLQIDWLYETKLNPKYINSMYWSVVTGIDYEAAPRWYYTFQTSWLNCFNNNKHHQPDIFSIQLGLQYKFF